MSVEAGYFLVGPTASGKSAVAHILAEEFGSGVLSADSMLVYRGMDIGTAKPTLAERAEVPYWGIDLVEPDTPFSVYAYRDAVRAQLAAVEHPPVVAGGTGLYVKSLVLGLDPQSDEAAESRAKWEFCHDTEGVEGLRQALRALAPDMLSDLDDPDNPRRLIRALERAEAGHGGARAWVSRVQQVPVVGLRVEPALLAERIERRVDEMYAHGLAEEMRELLASGVTLARTAAQAIGYAEVIDYVRGLCTLDEAKARTVVRTRRLAKRQRTWFRHQVVTEWVDVGAGEDPGQVARRVREVWERYGATPIMWE